MSHCVIENVCGDLCEAIVKFKSRQQDVQSNPYEKARIENLYNLCKEYVKEYEEYIGNPEQYIAIHSEKEDEYEY